VRARNAPKEVPMLSMLIWMMLAPIFEGESAESIAMRAGAECPYGCIVDGENHVYELTRDDVTAIALVAKAESGPRFVRNESAATVWAMVQRFADANSHRCADDQLSLSSLIRRYSAVLNDRWRTGGRSYHPRITPRADSYTGMGWDDLQTVWQFFAIEFIEGEVANPLPGVVHVLARGFEEHANADLIGPFYASTKEQHPGGNAYYKTVETEWWAPWTVRVVPASLHLEVSHRMRDQPTTSTP
jgi:hypothetical protein